MSAVCLSCGLCCDGTLFPNSRVGADESLLELRRTGTEILDGEFGPFFTMPCTALRGCACTVYDARPRICRAFRCAILRALDHGELDEPSALAIVLNTRALRDRLRTNATFSDLAQGRDGEPTFRRRVMQFIDSAQERGPEFRRANAALLADAVAFAHQMWKFGAPEK